MKQVWDFFLASVYFLHLYLKRIIKRKVYEKTIKGSLLTFVFVSNIKKILKNFWFSVIINIIAIERFIDYYEKNLETELREFCKKYIGLDKRLTQEQTKEFKIILRNMIRKEKNLNVWKKDLKEFIFSLTSSLTMETE